ncbi:MAG: branched-chain amino acid transport system II carrier protein [Lutibacter sp.]|nr:branched-chain amino acid transport system II carrier protein [Lutibacter sp.]
MNKTKEILITGFALFSMFFGAGNLILPPYIGFKAGESWFFMLLGFTVTAVIIPIFGILAHAKLQGTMYDFGKKVSPLFSWVYCFVVYAISISLPVPRTASVTHEMAIAPFFNAGSLVTSTVYFALVLVFALNRSKILDLLGKFLTPLIILILLLIIFIGIFSYQESLINTSYPLPFVNGILEGYQTFDAIGSVVVGSVLIISLKLKGNVSFEVTKKLIRNAGFVAGFGLLVIYGGLILNGAMFAGIFEENATRTEVLSGLSTAALGNIGTVFLSVLVALACFTTAVGIVIGTADFFKGFFNESKLAYIAIVVISCGLGIVIGQFDVHYIIKIALPVLMFIYPITIVLIFLNVIPEKYAATNVFRIVVLTAFIFSVPDFLKFLMSDENLKLIQQYIPFSSEGLGWLMPSIIAFIAVNLFKNKKHDYLNTDF